MRQRHAPSGSARMISHRSVAFAAVGLAMLVLLGTGGGFMRAADDVPKTVPVAPAPLVRSARTGAWSDGNTWSKLAQHAKRGETAVTVQGDLTGWRAGDRVILTGTFHPDGDEKAPVLAKTSQTEERVIVSVRGREERGATLKLDQSLAFD